jgi:hypothetical protein
MTARFNELAIEAHDDKRASKATAASLETSLEEQTETSRRLQAENEELKASQLETSADITNLEQARADLLQFMYNAFLLVPGAAEAFLDDDKASIVELTKQRLELCEYARDKMDRARKIISNQLREAQANVEILVADTRLLSEAHENQARVAATLREQLTTANDLLTGRDNHITVLTADVAARNARIEALLTARQTALEEHLRVAVALEKLKINHSALKKFVEEIIRDEA